MVWKCDRNWWNVSKFLNRQGSGGAWRERDPLGKMSSRLHHVPLWSVPSLPDRRYPLAHLDIHPRHWDGSRKENHSQVLLSPSWVPELWKVKGWIEEMGREDVPFHVILLCHLHTHLLKMIVLDKENPKLQILWPFTPNREAGKCLDKSSLISMTS